MKKRILIGVVGFMSVLIGSFGAVQALSDHRQHQKYDVSVEPLQLPTSAEALAEGKRLSRARGCAGCHGADFTGTVVLEEAPLARLVAPNITPAGVTAEYGVEDWVRSIRHGVAPDGRPLLFMPSHEYWPLADAEIAKIVAYLRQVPAVDTEPVHSEVGPVGRMLHVFGAFPLIPAERIDHEAPRPAPPRVGANAEYGVVLAVACIGCHGEDYSGGPMPGAPDSLPVPANLTPHDTGLGSWTFADFEEAMRNGKRPDGSAIDEFMPWKDYRHMNDVELEAVWKYLQQRPPLPKGGR